MRNICIVFLCLTIIVLSGVSYLTMPTTKKEYLRIHIRANSNEQIDQAVKYKVKDDVVAFLTPKIAECDTFQKAINLLTDNLTEIEKVANTTLKENGFTYTSKASVKNEKFPTRKYEDLVLDGGFYDALILELGSGDGDNWWCVVYPPLCFVGNGEGYVYKSKIMEIINNFFD